ncbi:MAG TPA: M56 family metallopeptidase [Rhizomicrobium sp.]|nr:M56 family metallopeptidase [Rhizomicrobium sp.]
MILGLLDHLWQSTLFAGGAWLLTCWLRRNPARLRFRLWFAASLKFLLPFAALSAAGESLSRLFPTAVPHLVLAVQPAARRLSEPAQALVARQDAASVHALPWLVGLWLAGFALVLAVRLMRWARLRAVVGQAHDLKIAAPVDVKASRTLLEPGLVGIFNPVVLLPEGLMSRLSRAERDAILAHELSHFSSGDNMTAAIHMLVEALFWFYPPVWLIGARLIAERERACDESVLADGHDAEVYAQAILRVCRFCVQSPLPCASGASGADLAHRVRQIMSDETVSGPGAAQKALLAVALMLALGLPVIEGFVGAPRLMADVQQQVAAQLRMAAGIARVAVEAQRIAAPVMAAPAPMKIRHVPRPKVTKTSPPELSPPEFSSQAQRLAEAAAQPQPQASASAAAPTPPMPRLAAVAANTVSSSPAGVRDVVMALYPQGRGDPDSVTCRVPEALPGSRLPGPKVCQTNRQWASLRARHEDITPDGEGIILPNGGEQRAGYVVVDCPRERITVTGAPNTLTTSASACF